jgi:hypothetical protein
MVKKRSQPLEKKRKQRPSGLLLGGAAVARARRPRRFLGEGQEDRIAFSRKIWGSIGTFAEFVCNFPFYRVLLVIVPDVVNQ